MHLFTGRGPLTGTCCGTACSPSALHKSRSDPDRHGPKGPYQTTTVDALGKPADQPHPHPARPTGPTIEPKPRSTSQLIHGFQA
jgi:hypothetical protein